MVVGATALTACSKAEPAQQQQPANQRGEFGNQGRAAQPGPPPGSLDGNEVRSVLAGCSMPAEWAPHERTIMGWPSAEGGWGPAQSGADGVVVVRKEIAELARTIARFEPVVLCAMPDQVADAQRMCGTSVEVVPIPVDDLWARDTSPNFVTGPQGVTGIDFNFNAWGNRRDVVHDNRLSRRILERFGVRRVQAPIIAEGGALEVDGDGTLIATESSIVNDNRNFGRSRDQLEGLLRELLGVRKVIWLAGLRGKDSTDGHIDLISRFIEPGVVVVSHSPDGAPSDLWTPVWEESRRVLASASDAAGRKLRVIDLYQADARKLGDHGPDLRTSYVNYYVCNGAVIVPAFGDEPADERALATLRDLHPGREAVAVNIRNFAEGGGGIHCATMQQPKL
ncbi:agmatine deiminase family protein [Nocardia colli]|uniref:Agmatine deiminase family protein n=2 Tax=Nocardia colli TaxID=2545717 RepID=A0A5N0ELR0_9NOCA|nr:agmatine deiminase family protein [Nocardia colli]